MKFILISLLFFLFFKKVDSFSQSSTAFQERNEVNSKSDDPAVGLNLGNKAPEIVQKNPEGNNLTLSSLQGKLVLIDFWASWCGPCRLENPYLVKAYTAFRNSHFGNAKGFTVYSVSLDSDEKAWKKGIEKDGLLWENHVSDLKGWNNEAALRYNINSIPTNLLVNENGVIIRKNIKGEDLINLLQKLSDK